MAQSTAKAHDVLHVVPLCPSITSVVRAKPAGCMLNSWLLLLRDNVDGYILLQTKSTLQLHTKQNHNGGQKHLFHKIQGTSIHLFMDWMHLISSSLLVNS